MIPFARIVKYGNIISSSKVVKIISGQKTWIMLLDDGSLYGRGEGAIGDGKNEFRNDWTLLNTNVRNFWVAPIGPFICVQKNDNTVEYCGDMRYRMGTTGTVVLNFTPDPYFSSNSIKIKSVSFNNNYQSMGIIDDTNKFLIIGSPRALNGSSTVNTNWTFVANSVVAIANSGTNWWSLNSSNVVAGGGQNISNIFSTGASESTFYTYPISISSDGYGAKPTLIGGQYWVAFTANTLSNVLYGRGFGNSGSFGNGSNNSLTSSTLISSSWPNRASLLNMGDPSYFQNATLMYYTSNGFLYYSGSGLNRGVSSTANVYSMTAISVTFDPSTIVYLDVGWQTTYVYLSDGRIFMSGDVYTSSTNKTPNILFTDVTNMFGSYVKHITRDSMINGIV